MILPTKRISPQRSLIGVGHDVLALLNKPKTVSQLWSEHKKQRSENRHDVIGYDWFVLSLDLLYSLNAIQLSDGYVTKQDAKIKNEKVSKSPSTSKDDS